MAQEHLDRLSAVDVGFLAQEGPNTHMHIGGVALFDGPAPDFEDVRALFERRLHLVPRYRQKLAFPPLQSGLPVWIDDPHFNLGYHLRHAALPRPGGEDALLRLVSRTFSLPLDRGKPLWEFWIVEGVGDGRWAAISKGHHALVDGVSGMDIAAVLLDLEPKGTPRPPAEPWVPRPEPTAAQLAAHGLAHNARRAVRVTALAAAGLADPRRLGDNARELAGGIGALARTGLDAPDRTTPINAPPGPSRRLAVVRAELADLKAIKGALGGTVNDIVLTAVAGGLAQFLRSRGMDPAATELRACVPVSVRSEAQRQALGNAITVMMAPLPVQITDPTSRLRRVREVMDGLKDSKQALGAKAIADAQDLTPPGLVAQASRLQFATRMYNLLVTNVPGPQFPLYMLGRRMQTIIPIPFLAGNRSLAVAILSYDGHMDFGLLGDWDALPDLDVVADGIAVALEELKLAAAKAERVASRKARRRTASRAGSRS